MDRNAGSTCFVEINRWTDGQRLAAIIERSRIKLRDWPVKGVTKYKNWPLRDTTRLEECGEWTFGGIVSVPYETPTTTFLWNPPPVIPVSQDENEALVERMKGKLISSYPTTKNYPWPNILKDLKIVRADFNGFPISDWVPGDNIPSVVEVKLYVSDVAPSRFFLQTDTPKPTEVRGNYYATDISFPPCLHGEVVLYPFYTNVVSIDDAMPDKIGGRVDISKVVHEPTNHATWKDHIFDVDVVEDDGLYFRTVMKVIAPRLPRTVLV